MCQSIKSQIPQIHTASSKHTIKDKLGLLVTTSNRFIVPYFPANPTLWPTLNRSTSPHSKRPGFPVNQAKRDPNSSTPIQLWAFV